MGCSSKAFKEPCALLINKNAVPLSPLCASSPLDAQNVVSFSEVSLSLLSVGRNANLIWGVAVKLSKSRVLSFTKKFFPFSSLCASSPLDAQNVVSFSEVSLSLLSLSPLMAYHSAGAQWQAGGALI